MKTFFKALSLLLITLSLAVSANSGWNAANYPPIRDLPVASADTGSWIVAQCPGVQGCFNRINPDSLGVYTRSYLQGKVTRAAVVESSLSGYATTRTDSLRYFADSNHCEFYLVAGISGTSNANALTFGHAPAGCRPSHTLPFTAFVTDNGVERVSKATLAATGVFTVYAADTSGIMSATGFTTSGTKSVILIGSLTKY